MTPPDKQIIGKISSTIIFCIVIILCQSSMFGECHETDMKKELILTQQEKLAFDKLKSQVFTNVSSSRSAHPFMRTDLFLLRWIRAKNLDVNLAVRDMFACLEWRRVNQINKIHQEDWDDIIEEHPYHMDITDLQGRPVAIGSIGSKWNIRGQIVAGRQRKMERYAYKLIEEVFDRTYQINRKHPNITQFSVIASLEGFNLVQHACPLCLTNYIRLLATYNRFYPNFAHVIIVVNTPGSFNVILDLVRPMLTKPTRDALRMYGYNKREWKPVLDQEVNPNQLTYEFGGTRPDDGDYN